LEVITVPFLGTELIAARDPSGQVWAGVRQMCAGIGLSFGQTRNEQRKIKADEAFSDGWRKFRLPTNGGFQEVLCIKLEHVPFWLSGICITPAMRSKHPELADRLKQFRLKARDALAEAFAPAKSDTLTKGQSSFTLSAGMR